MKDNTPSDEVQVAAALQSAVFGLDISVEALRRLPLQKLSDLKPEYAEERIGALTDEAVAKVHQTLELLASLQRVRRG